MSQMYRVAFVDPLGGYIQIEGPLGMLYLHLFGAGAPTSGAKDCAISAVYMDTTNGYLYRNTGTTTSATWTRLDAGVDLSTLTATASELNNTADLSGRVTAFTPAAASTTTLDTTTSDLVRYITTSTISFTVAFPAFTGSGAKWKFVFSTTLSSATATFSATGAYLIGTVIQNTDSANGSSGFTVGAIPAAASTNVTLNGGTKGGRAGDWIEVIDLATNVGLISGFLNASGTEATPFS